MATPQPSPEPQWPLRFREFCRQLQAESATENQDAARGEVWLILNEVIHRAALKHARRYGEVSREDLEDIAATKALELLNRIEARTLDLTDRSSAQLASFLISVARNGLMDLFREHARRTLRDVEASSDRVPSPQNAAHHVENRDFADALRDCVAHLTERARTIWIFRVFYDMSSKEIASHPEVRLRPGHVDVVLQRCRAALRECMGAKGHEVSGLPTGVVVALWRAFRQERTRAAPSGVK
jgi:RNA polymerase sigma factor (sigma-70 family)